MSPASPIGTDFTKAFTGPLADVMDRPGSRIAAVFLGSMFDAGVSRIHIGDIVDIARDADRQAKASDSSLQVSPSDVKAVIEALRAVGVAEFRSCPTGRVRLVSGEDESVRLHAESAPNTEFFYRLNLERLRELIPSVDTGDILALTTRRLRVR